MALSLEPQAEASESGPSVLPRPHEDMLKIYLEIEEEFCASEDYISMITENGCSPNLIWREMVCKWGYDVVDMMGEARSVVYVAMNILDRFCAVVAQTEAPMNEKRYECASMTALFLAARVAGNSNLQTTDLIYMSRDSVQLEDITAMGKKMLNVLTWGPRVITPVDFLQAMLKSLPASVEEARRTSLFESASFLAEIAVCDIYLSRFPASQVAFASILNAAFIDPVLSQLELEGFCDRMEQEAFLLHYSIDTRTIRSRLDSVYNRIEDNSQDSSTAPNYVSDDEEDETEAPAAKRKRCYSTDDDEDDDFDHGQSQEASTRGPILEEKALRSSIDQERWTKRQRRRSSRRR